MWSLYLFMHPQNQESALLRLLLLFLLSGSTQQLEVVDINLGHITLDLVIVFPRTSAELAFDIELSAFLDIVCGNLGIAAPHHYVVPLGALRHLCAIGSSVATVGGSKRERHYGLTL